MSIVYLNGSWEAYEKAALALSDELLMGNGIFTTIKVKEGRIFFLSDHLRRLQEAAHIFQIVESDIPIDCFSELVERNNARKGAYKLKAVLLSGGQQQPAFQTLLTIAPYFDEGCLPCRLNVYPQPVIKPTAKVKCLAYMDRLLIKRHGTDQGLYDSLCFSPEGYILETGFSNIFWKIDDELFTPEPSLPLFYGITIQKILHSMPGLKARLVAYRLEEVPESAQVFVCNALTGPRPVVQIENRSFARDPAWEEHLLSAYCQSAYNDSTQTISSFNS